MAEQSGFTVNSTFNPDTQLLNVLAPDGQTSIPVPIADIIAIQTVTVGQGIIYGIQIGLCALLLVMLMLMTKTDKRRSPVFLLNTITLLLVLLRNILTTVELTTIFYNFYNEELAYYPSGPALRHAMSISTAGEIISFSSTAAVYFSMILQIHIVCCTLQHWQRKIVVGGCALIALGALAVRLTLAVLNIKWNILGIADPSLTWQWNVFNRVAEANKDVTVIAIGLYSCVFIVKLAFAIVLRRKLRMKQFGPMQIIFIMGCQTLFIPLIFAIATSFVPEGVQLNSFISTMAAIFLPLSGMWASAKVTDHKLVDNSKRFPMGGSDFASAKAYGTLSNGSQTKGSDTTQASTLISDNELFIMSGGSMDDSGITTSQMDDPEKQMQLVTDGGHAHVIGVSRTFSIRSGRQS